jgi:Na+-driven multidrug efflux pump
MLVVNFPVMLIFVNYFGVLGAGYGVAVTFCTGAVFQIFLFVKYSQRTAIQTNSAYK